LENDIKMNLKGTVCDGVDRIQFAQGTFKWRAHLNTVMSLRMT